MNNLMLDGTEEPTAIAGGFGAFEADKNGKDEWLTPPEIIRALGEFDLDPCSPVNRPWPTAKRHFTALDNGLIRAWEGRVWMNPPYGNQCIRFMRKLSEHRNGIALICARTETKMFFETVWDRADGVFFFKGRLTFYHVTGKPSNNCIGAPSVLVAYGIDNLKAIESSGLDGRLIRLSPPTPVFH